MRSSTTLRATTRFAAALTCSWSPRRETGTVSAYLCAVSWVVGAIPACARPSSIKCRPKSKWLRGNAAARAVFVATTLW